MSAFKIPKKQLSIKYVAKYKYDTITTSKKSDSAEFTIYKRDVAIVHTHPLGSGIGITQLSPQDKKVAIDFDINMYVYGPNGVLMKYNSLMDEPIVVFDDLPHSPYKPWLH